MASTSSDEVGALMLAYVIIIVVFMWLCHTPVRPPVITRARFEEYVSGTQRPTPFLSTDSACVVAVNSSGTVYVGYTNGCIKAWKAGRDFPSAVMHRHQGAITSIVFSPRHKMYSGSTDRLARSWDTNDGTHLQSLCGHSGTVSSVAVGPDGRVYTGSHDTTVRVWTTRCTTDPLSRAVDVCTDVLEGHTDCVTAVAIGVDGKVYSGSYDQTIRVWSGGINNAYCYTIQGHASAVTALAVGVDGSVYSGSDDGTIRVWQKSDGAPIKCTHTNGRVMAFAVDANDDIYVCTSYATVHVHTLQNGLSTHQLVDYDRIRVRSIVVNHAGVVYTCSVDGNVMVW